MGLLEMTSRALKSALLSGAALVGLALSSCRGVRATSVGLGLDPSDFGVIEGPGQYTVFNNSSDWYIYEFSVTNPDASHDYTFRPNWFADNCGSGCGVTFEFIYGNNSGPFDFADDIGPGTSDNRFFFGSPPASTYTIDLVNSDGAFTSVAGGAGVPEPASWALMIAGFGLAGAALRRRRSAALTA